MLIRWLIKLINVLINLYLYVSMLVSHNKGLLIYYSFKSTHLELDISNYNNYSTCIMVSGHLNSSNGWFS